MVFRVRAEKFLPAANADVCALRFRIGVLAGERRFSSLFPRHLKLLFGQLRTPFRITLLNFFAHLDILHRAVILGNPRFDPLEGHLVETQTPSVILEGDFRGD